MSLRVRPPRSFPGRARAPVPLAALAALVALTRVAGADDRTAEMPKFPASIDELSAPRLPPPFVLPELSHPFWDIGIGWLVGVGATPSGGGARTSPALGLGRVSFEGDIAFPRRFYIGATLPFASALAPDGGGAKSVPGNVESHVRVVFPLPSWLAFGAELGVVAPTARFDRGTSAHRAAVEASSLEPTDAVHFVPDAFALRPAMDLRVLRGPLVVQVRQGMDIVLDTSGGRAVTSGRFLGHAGVRLLDQLEVSVEATQSYLFDERFSDRRRTSMTIGPGARLSLGTIDLGMAVVSSLFDPISVDLERFVALRFSIVEHLGN